jgi:hypothetical protein
VPRSRALDKSVLRCVWRSVTWTVECPSIFVASLALASGLDDAVAAADCSRPRPRANARLRPTAAPLPRVFWPFPRRAHNYFFATAWVI